MKKHPRLDSNQHNPFTVPMLRRHGRYGGTKLLPRIELGFLTYQVRVITAILQKHLSRAQDSNLQPFPYEGIVLPTELPRHFGFVYLLRIPHIEQLL